MTADLDEPILPDDYPIYGNFNYLADGKLIVSDWHGITAREFKAREGIKELRRYDGPGREMALRKEMESHRTNIGE